MGVEGARGDLRVRREASWLCVCVAFLTAYPPVLSVLEQGVAAPFRFFSADAFYYLAVAKHARSSWIPSFDGALPSNGFHPLWQAILSTAAREFDLSEVGLVWMAFWSSVALATVGSVLFALATLHRTKSFWWALLATVPGFFYWAFGSLDPHYYSSWALSSGMESGLSCLFFGALAWWLVTRSARPTTAGLVVSSLLATGLLLARLDDVFYLVGLCLYAAASSPERRLILARVAQASAVPALALGGYLVFNWAYAGHALPVSGMWKHDGLAALVRNLGSLVVALSPVASDTVQGGGSLGWAHWAQKTLALAVPGVTGLVWLRKHARSLRSSRMGQRTTGITIVATDPLFVLVAGTFLKCAYNLLFVGIWSQGAWYHTAPLLTLHLLLAEALAQTLGSPGARSKGGSLHAWLPRAATLVVLLVAAGSFAKTKADPKYHDHYLGFFRERAGVDRELEHLYGRAGVLAYDDGIIAFSLERRVMSGLGYGLDAEAAAAKKQGDLLELAHARGVRLLASTNYFPPIAPSATSSEIRRALRKGTTVTQWEKLDAWDFAVAPLESTQRGTFIAFSPRTTPPTEEVDRDRDVGLARLWKKLRERLRT